MEAPDFWDDAEVSQKKMKELKDMKDDMETYQNLVTQMEDMETMIEMGYEENDPALIPEIQEMLDEFQKDFDNIRIKTLLSGEYDSENAIIKLNAGAGGTERPVTGAVCFTVCTAAGQIRKDLPLKCWIIWTAMRKVSNRLLSR